MAGAAPPCASTAPGDLLPRAERSEALVGSRPAATGLARTSVAVPLGLELVDRSWLGNRVGQLPGALLDAVDSGIRAVLGL